MELKIVETLAQPELLEQVKALLVLADQEFIPPLSYRGSTTQQSLQDTQGSIEIGRAHV